MEIAFIYVTCQDDVEAKTIAKTVISEKLAACANILPSMRAIYMWEGQLKDDLESVLWLKSTKSHVNKLTERIQALHSYSTPCIAAIPIDSMNADYKNWLTEQVQETST